MRVITLDLLRHGHTCASGIYQGSSDVVLSAQGVDQMQQAFHAGTGLGWQGVYSSPLRRCCVPAQQGAAQLGVHCTLLPWLTEYHFGHWEGRSFDAVYTESPLQVEQFWCDPERYPPPESEPVSRFQQRVREGVNQLLDTDVSHCLLVTHGGVIRALIADCLAMPPSAWSKIKLDHAHFTRIQFYLDGNGKTPWAQLVHTNVAGLSRVQGLSELDADL